jgi:hypothetical protein
VPLLIIPVLVVLAMVALIPVALVQRYRMGTARQRARGWLTTINIAGLMLSAAMFLVSAAFTSIWVPGALSYTAAGLAAGGVLGAAGLWLTRWEPGSEALYYTPSRWLVLGITLVVTARVLFGFWRAWHTWSAGLEDGSWFAAAGVEQSMAAGAVVLGYYLVYWVGVRRRIRRRATEPRR